MFNLSSCWRALSFRRYLASERAAVDYCNEVVDGQGRQQYLDKVASVSGAFEVEVDAAYVPDHNQLFLEVGEDPHGCQKAV